MADALLGLLPIVAGMALAVLPLVVVLPSSPSLVDDVPPTTPTIPTRRHSGWRISVSITRVDTETSEQP